MFNSLCLLQEVDMHYHQMSLIKFICGTSAKHLIPKQALIYIFVELAEGFAVKRSGTSQKL